MRSFILSIVVLLFVVTAQAAETWNPPGLPQAKFPTKNPWTIAAELRQKIAAARKPGLCPQQFDDAWRKVFVLARDLAVARVLAKEKEADRTPPGLSEEAKKLIRLAQQLFLEEELDYQEKLLERMKADKKAVATEVDVTEITMLKTRCHLELIEVYLDDGFERELRAAEFRYAQAAQPIVERCLRRNQDLIRKLGETPFYTEQAAKFQTLLDECWEFRAR